MRPIKFRAWDSKHKVWLARSDFSVNGRGEVIHRHISTENPSEYWINCDELELSQFTGFHDKNGREIYDGDILHSPAPWPGASDSYTKVFWHQGRNAGWYETLDGKTMTELDGDACSRLREIVGNILENPDLIREKPAKAGGED
jgi:uncharacterized phage protein (TIGR01671 family)